MPTQFDLHLKPANMAVKGRQFEEDGGGRFYSPSGWLPSFDGIEVVKSALSERKEPGKIVA